MTRRATTDANVNDNVQTHAGAKRRVLLASTALAAAGLALFSANPAKALPQGENVVGGDVAYDRSVPGTLTGNQVTDRAYTLWDTFDTAAGESVILNLPSSGALSVNKVTGLVDIDGTQFDGLLSSNGNVWILDANGVFFGASARVDVGGILASTGDLGVADVMDGDGKFDFSDFGDGQIVNFGTMNVSDAGLAAFVAPYAANSGVINAKLGTVSFAAGEKVTLDMYGDGLYEIAVEGKLADALLENREAGRINAEGGTVHMAASAAKSAVDNIINLEGVTTVASATVQGGKIILSGGGKGTVKISGAADASGKTGGGKINVTGENIEIAATAALKADAADNGDGGEIHIYGDRYARLDGFASAQGGINGGKGGFIELSAGEAVGFNGRVSAYAAMGGLGTFLIDPKFIIVHSGLTNLANAEPFNFTDKPGSSNDFYANKTDQYVVSANALANALATSNVRLEADDFIDVGTRSDYTGVDLGGLMTVAAANALEDGDINLYQGVVITGAPGHGQGEPPPQANNNCNANGTCSAASGFVLTGGNLDLKANEVNFNRTVNMGKGTITVDANIAGLGAAINGLVNTGGNDALNVLGDTRLVGVTRLTTINVLSPNARINQAIAFADSSKDKLIDVAAGTYNESVAVNKSKLTLRGAANLGSSINPNSPGFHITGNQVVIDGFTITNADHGIFIDNAGKVTVKNNDIHSLLSGDGIYATGVSHLAVTGNRIAGTGDNGIEIRNSAGAQIAGNEIVNAAGHGISLNQSDNSAIAGNTVLSAALNGIYSEGSKNVIIGGATAADGNMVTDAGLDGIRVSFGMKNTVQGNAIDGAGNNGISVIDSAHALIDGNNIADTAGHGIFVDPSPNSLVSGNIVSHFGGNAFGIYVLDSGDTIVDDNDISFGGTGIRVEGSENVQITDNDMQDIDIDGIHVLAGSHDVLIRDSRVIDTAQVAGSEAIRIDDSDFADVLDNITNKSWVGIAAYNSNNLTVDGNQGTLVRTGVLLDDVHTAAVNGNIMGVTVMNVADTVGVDVKNSSDIAVTGNSLDDFIAGVRIVDSDTVNVDENNVTDANYGVLANTVSGLVVTNNDLDGHTGAGKGTAGIHVTNSAGAQVGSAGSGNSVSDFNVGIRIENGAHTLVEDNGITGFTTFGVRTLGSATSTVNANVIDNDGAAGVGISVENGNGTAIAANDIDNVAGNGIQLIDSHDAQILSNTLDNIGGNGIWVDSSDDAEVAYNVLNAITLDGIRVDGGVEADIHGNTIAGIAENGIDINDHEGANVEFNLVSDTEGHGIRVAGGADVHVHDNHVQSAGGNGIDAEGSYDILIEDNGVEDIAEDGIHVADIHAGEAYEDGPLARIIGNVVSNVDGDGIEVYAVDDSRIKGNFITAAGEDGIKVTNFVENDPTRIIGNVISNIGDNGIEVTGIEDVAIRRNFISHTGGDGIHLTHFLNADIFKNTILNAGENGIFADGYNDEGQGYTIRIARNLVERTGESGIRNGYTGDVSIFGNVVLNADETGIDVYNADNVAIGSNLVFRTGSHGIQVADSGYAVIGANRVYRAGYGGGMFNRDRFHADGIHVEDVHGYNGGSDRWVDGEGPFVIIGGNIVKRTFDDGIAVEDSGATLVFGNNVSRAGLYPFGFGSDGISIRDIDGSVSVAGNTVYRNMDDGIDIADAPHAEVIGNKVFDNGDDGLAVRNVYNYDTLIVFRNSIYGNHGDGVDVSDIYGGAFFTDNAVTGNGLDGIKIRYVDRAEISGNTISRNGDDGIDADWINTPTTLIIEGNRINGNADNGIEVSNSLTTEILNNLIYNNGAHGLFMQGANNWFVTLSGNVFTGNPVHARFESGLIDLTGDGNVFNFGDIALQFAPAPIYGYPFKGEGDFAPSFKGPEAIGHAPMALVGETIGSQFFNGQSAYFVALSNGAFFNPGTPTILDAADSTFVTPFGIVNPSATGDSISADVHAFLENMFFHFNDDSTLGLFFFNQAQESSLESADIDQEDIFRTFGGFGPTNGNISFTLNGLPFVDPALALAAISPAAGGEEEEERQTPQSLADIEPAAGGDEGSTAQCWESAAASAAAGVRVNYSFGGGLAEALADAASCGGAEPSGT